MLHDDVVRDRQNVVCDRSACTPWAGRARSFPLKSDDARCWVIGVSAAVRVAVVVETKSEPPVGVEDEARHLRIVAVLPPGVDVGVLAWRRGDTWFEH